MDMDRVSILEELIKLSPLCSGKLYEQYFPCGKGNCRCQDEESPKLHGPYYTWVRRPGGKQVNRTLKPGPELEMVKEGIKNYHRFQVLCEELLRREEASVLTADRAMTVEGKKNSSRRLRKR